MNRSSVVDPPIDLRRRLAISPAEGDEPLDAAALFDWMADSPSGESSWDELLSQRRVILLVGPAHTGKTTELLLLQRRLRHADKACFFLDMSLVMRQSVHDALGTEADAFAEWLAGKKAGVILLDALDEAVLGDERALTTCLFKLTRALSGRGVDRCRFVISSRPGAWSTYDVLQLIRDQLAAPARRSRVQPNGKLRLDARWPSSSHLMRSAWLRSLISRRSSSIGSCPSATARATHPWSGIARSSSALVLPPHRLDHLNGSCARWLQ